MHYSGTTVSEKAVRGRIERFFERQEFENGFKSGVGDVVSSLNFIVPSPSSNTPVDTDPLPYLSTTTPGDAVPSFNLSTPPPCDPTSKDYSITKQKSKQLTNYHIG